jgi:hypothetical protein
MANAAAAQPVIIKRIISAGAIIVGFLSNLTSADLCSMGPWIRRNVSTCRWSVAQIDGARLISRAA